MASNANFLAFRRLVYNFSQRLSKEECQAIVFIRLHECRERYRDASTLDVFSKLEMEAVFSPGYPDGLIDIATNDIHRPDLVNLVKNFIKSHRSKGKKAKAKNASSADSKCSHVESSGEETAQLRATLEVTLSQASVLAQQVDILQRAIVSKERRKAAEANKKPGRAVEELAAHLRKVQKELERRSPRPSSSSSEEGPSQQGVDAMQTCSQEAKPIPKPRKFNRHLQESCPEQGSPEPVRVPVQETCNPARTLTSYLNRTDVVSENRQQGILLGDRRGKPRRQAISGTHSQSAPASPSLKRDSGQCTSHFKPAVPPRTRKPPNMTPPVPAVRHLPPNVPTKTLVDDSEDYATLCPVINDDDTPTTGDSGYGGAEEWKQHMRYPPPFEDSEEHYYKSLYKDETDKDGDYEELQH